MNHSKNFRIEIQHFFLLGFLLLVVSDSNILIDYISLPGGARHFILVAFFLIILLVSNVKLLIPKKLSYIVIATAIYSAILFYLKYTNFLSSVIGLTFTFLFLFGFIISYSLNISKTSFFKILSIFSFFVALSAVPTFIYGLVSGDLRATPTLYRELGAHGFTLNVALITSLFCFRESRKSIFIFIALALVVFIFFTTLKKSILEAMLIIFLYLFFAEKLKFSHRLTSIILSFLFISPILFFVGQDLIDNINANIFYLNNAGNEGHVRIGMYIAAISIAVDNFPLGSGFGTFGSLGSILGTYSPLYYQYGVSGIGANSYQHVLDQHHTLLDTFWPHIIAELGFIGLMLFFLLFFYPFISSIFKYTDKNRGVFFIIAALTLITFLDGLALYTPEVPVFIFLVHFLLGLSFRKICVDA